jgi:hypothetical protein
MLRARRAAAASSLFADDVRWANQGLSANSSPRPVYPPSFGVDRKDQPAKVLIVGSIKWREREPFGRADLATLLRDSRLVPGVDEQTPRIAVARSGSTTNEIAVLSPAELLEAWQ